jgi:hypothetical protein
LACCYFFAHTYTLFSLSFSATRTIGQTIQAGGIFTSAKDIEAVGIKSYKVVRGGNGDAAEWDLWALAARTSATANDDSYTTIGTAVNFQRSIVGAAKKSYTIATYFTPNIRLNTALAQDLTTSRAAAMIVLPDDRNKELTFTITIALRLYSDTTSSFRRRRLMYRDESVPLEPVNDIELQTSPVTLKVPATVQISKDGSVTVYSAPATLSVGAIAGIAAIGAAVAAAAIGLTVVVVRKHKQTAAAKADAEAALVQQGSTEFMIKEQKSAPLYPINTRVVA